MRKSTLTAAAPARSIFRGRRRGGERRTGSVGLFFSRTGCHCRACLSQTFNVKCCLCLMQFCCGPLLLPRQSFSESALTTDGSLAAHHSFIQNVDRRRSHAGISKPPLHSCTQFVVSPFVDSDCEKCSLPQLKAQQLVGRVEVAKRRTAAAAKANQRRRRRRRCCCCCRSWGREKCRQFPRADWALFSKYRAATNHGRARVL